MRSTTTMIAAQRTSLHYYAVRKTATAAETVLRRIAGLRNGREYRRTGMEPRDTTTRLISTHKTKTPTMPKTMYLLLLSRGGSPRISMFREVGVSSIFLPIQRVLIFFMILPGNLALRNHLVCHVWLPTTAAWCTRSPHQPHHERGAASRNVVACEEDVAVRK